ncbi:uncharacterized protein LOC144589050 isoform X1 [Pogona vitticeps]
MPAAGKGGGAFAPGWAARCNWGGGSASWESRGQLPKPCQAPSSLSGLSRGIQRRPRLPPGCQPEISSAKAPVYVTLLKKEEAKLFKQSYTKCHQMNEEHMHIMEDRGGEPNMWEWSTVSASIRSSH